MIPPEISLKNAINFRSLGGYISAQGKLMKTGLVYRSGDLSNLLPEEASYLAGDLKLKLYCDTRSDEEIARNGYPKELTAAGVKYGGVPVSSSDAEFFTMKYPQSEDYACHYLQLLEIMPGVLIKIFGIIAEGRDLPFVFGCSAGKDRTGVISAMLLNALHMDDETIVMDYAWSSKFLSDHLDRFSYNWKRLGISRKDYAPRMKPVTNTMYLFLSYMRKKYGTVGNYLTEIGIDEETLSLVQKQLLE
jgi:protein-tyrosine phosphatase